MANSIKVEVHEKLFFAQKIEKYGKFNRSKVFSKFLRILKTLKNSISEKKSKMYMEESVENILD